MQQKNKEQVLIKCKQTLILGYKTNGYKNKIMKVQLKHS